MVESRVGDGDAMGWGLLVRVRVGGGKALAPLNSRSKGEGSGRVASGHSKAFVHQPYFPARYQRGVSGSPYPYLYLYLYLRSTMRFPASVQA